MPKQNLPYIGQMGSNYLEKMSSSTITPEEQNCQISVDLHKFIRSYCVFSMCQFYIMSYIRLEEDWNQQTTTMYTAKYIKNEKRF